MKSLLALLKRDITLFIRSNAGPGQSIIFYLIVVILFPFSIGPDINLLTKISTGILWIILLLTILLSSEQIFTEDVEDGSLTLLLINNHLPELIVLIKLLAHWLSIILPLFIIIPLLSLILNLSLNNLYSLLICMIIGSLGLCSLTVIGASILINIKRSNQLIALLILPFYIPILIFGVNATNDITLQNVNNYSSLLILILITIMIVIITPFITTQALKINLK